MYIGGVHGSGKTTVCSLLSDVTFKQRRQLILAGQKDGLQWPEVAKFHDKYIKPAGDLVPKEGCLIVDCHYAIRAEKAVRPHYADGDAYIADLDFRFVQAVGVTPIFVLLTVSPEVAVNRLMLRGGFTEQEYTPEGNISQAKAEEVFWAKLVSFFGSSSLVIKNFNSSLTAELIKKKLGFLCPPI